MGQSFGQRCRPILNKCDMFCCRGECSSFQEFMGCSEMFPRGSVLREGEQTPLLATHLRLVTECDPPQGIAEYDLLLVNQVYNVCGQLNDGDLAPFMRSRIDCECNNHRHIAAFDTNLLHDEIVALCVIVRYDPAVVIKTCTVYVEAPGVHERLAEFRTVGEDPASARGGRTKEDDKAKKRYYNEDKPHERVFLAMVCSSQNELMWYFQAVNQEMGTYEEHTVGRIAGAAVVGEELTDDVAIVARTHSSRYGSDAASRSSRIGRAGGPAGPDQRSAYARSLNYHEGTTGILRSDRSSSDSATAGGIGGMFSMPNIRMPNLWGWGDRESSSAVKDQRITVQDPAPRAPQGGPRATLSPTREDARQRDSGGRNIAPRLPSTMQFAAAQNRFGAQPINYIADASPAARPTLLNADASLAARPSRSPLLDSGGGRSSANPFIDPTSTSGTAMSPHSGFEQPSRAYPMYASPTHRPQRDAASSKKPASQTSLTFFE
eukprot:GEMP01023129.1.p1 GENE.GEMP01023129.1~~GEMP01023129.1.p1  ORF type:complete len:491 (+),score=117.16 GEMP01023129.1:326-1798(+)